MEELFLFMLKTLVGNFDKKVFYTFAVLSVTAAALLFAATFNTPTAGAQIKGDDGGAISKSAAPSAIFPANAGTLGAIPDGAAGCGGYATSTPKDVTFTVSGISGTITDVRISTTFSPAHSWRGDLSLELLAPGGSPAKTIFRQTGSTTAAGCGSSSDAAGPYVFFDTAPASPTWWAVAGTPSPAGDYQASTPGGVVGGGANTPITPTFAGLGSAANGTWTLRILDGGGGDTGSISAASLEITTAVTANGPHDVDGDGTSDFVMVRADGPALGEFMGANDFAGKDKVGNMQRRAESAAPEVGIGWWTLLNNGTTPNRVSHGQDTDFFHLADVTGDARDELVAWSPGAAGVAAFRIFNAQTSTVTTRLFGQSGDDPSVLNDMNGDGKFDLVVYRDGSVGSPQSFFYWANEATPNVVNYIPWGTDGDIAYTLDYDGDSRGDVAIQRNAGGGVGHHWIRQSSNGAAVVISYGLSSDFVVPGDFDGDGRDDICVSRNANFGTGTFKYFWVRESDGGGNPASPIQWGIPGDFIAQGDYDGDGITDFGVWRSNADPSQNFFYVRRSSTGALQAQEWGQSGDYPVNNWDVH